MGLLCIIFLICSLRTNVAFFVIFLSLTIAFGLLTGAFWAQAEDFAGNAHYAHKLLVVRTLVILVFANTCSTLDEESLKKLIGVQGAGASAFVTCLAGWYILLAISLAIVDFPIQIPVGDLSNVVKGRSIRER